MDKMAIKFLAQNKFLLVEVFEENKTESSVALPDDYKVNQNEFKLGQILDAEENSTFRDHVGSYVVFPSNALQEISVHGLNVKMVPCHAVYGVLKNVEGVNQEIQNDQ